MIGIGRAYSVVFSGVGIAAEQEFFYIKPAADKVCVIEAIEISNTGKAEDAGDAQEEFLRVDLIRIPATVTASSGGTAPTPNPLSTNDNAAGFTARVNDTTVATTTGTALTLISTGFNIRAPYIWMPPPEHRILVANAQALVCRLKTAPTDSVTMSGTMIVRELP